MEEIISFDLDIPLKDIRVHSSANCYQLSEILSIEDLYNKPHKTKVYGKISYEKNCFLADLICEHLTGKYRESIDPDINSFTFFKFTENDSIKKNVNRPIDKYIFSRVIILIPSKHQGGTLKVWDKGNKLYEFDSSNKIKVIVLDPALEYEITEITSGTKMFFTKFLSFNKYLYNIVFAKPVKDIQVLEPDNSKLLNKINEIKDKMIGLFTNLENNLKDHKTILKEIEKTENNLSFVLPNEIVKTSNHQIANIIKGIKFYMNTKKYSIIPLMNYYPVSQKYMYRNDYLLYFFLQKLFGEIKIKNMKETIEYDYLFKTPDIDSIYPLESVKRNFGGEYSAYLGNHYMQRYIKSVKDKVIIINAFNIAEQYGHSDQKFEYIDGAYNLVRTNFYTCLIINIKNYDCIFTFLCIYSKRKEECYHLGILPKDIIRYITNFV